MKNNSHEIQKISENLFETYNLTLELERHELSDSQFSDISVKDLHIIHIIGMYKDLTITAIAKIVGLTKATLTSTIDKLERLDYVNRQRNTQDRRVINIILTKKGRLLFKLHNRLHREYINALLKDASSQELIDVNDHLERFVGYLKDRIDNATK